MGRAGAGGGGGGYHSSGGHSSSRSSGGHRVGGGSSYRAGSSHSHNYSSSHSHSSYQYNRNYGGVTYHGNLSPAAVLIIIMIITAAVLIGAYQSIPHSTINREKLDGSTYYNNYIVDEIGWFDNIGKTEKQLKAFYDKTGVQPYIVLHEYDPYLSTDESKEQWANDYYNENIHNEDTFLYVYFAEQDTDNDVGYMCYVNGKRVSSVMDSEAIDIFWRYIDKYWYTDMSTDKMFATVYTKTAKTIMHKSLTIVEFGVIAIVGIFTIVLVLILFNWWKAKVKRDKEKAEETERILNTPIEDLGGNK